MRGIEILPVVYLIYGVFLLWLGLNLSNIYKIAGDFQQKDTLKVKTRHLIALGVSLILIGIFIFPLLKYFKIGNPNLEGL